MTTIAAVVDDAVQVLCDAGFSREEARRDAGVLARGLMRWTMADWLARSSAEPPDGFKARFNELIARRSSHEPVAYLLGEREFYGRAFRVTRDTLIPRPETEGLVDQALHWVQNMPGDRPLRIVDVGTGTGCIAITLALEIQRTPPATVIAIDTSESALAVAGDNAQRFNAGALTFRQGSLLADIRGPVELIVSNPPYVAEADRGTLQPDVVDFEPAEALFAGGDGLDVIRQLIPAARDALAPGGVLIFEIGMDQAPAVMPLLQAAGFSAISQHPDLQGIDRIIVAQKPGRFL